MLNCQYHNFVHFLYVTKEYKFQKYYRPIFSVMTHEQKLNAETERGREREREERERERKDEILNVCLFIAV